MDFLLAAMVQGLGYSAMGLGIYLSLRIFQLPDITTDGSFTLGAAVTALCLLNGWGWVSAFLMSLLAGGLAGTATGVIHTRLGIQPLLAGILVMTALYSVNLLLMGRSNLPVVNVPTVSDSLTAGVATTNWFLVMLIFILLLTLLLWWLLKTDFGIAMRATGNSETMVRACGVNTAAMKTAGLALANAYTAASGFLICQFQQFADINMGIGIVILGLGSVIIGEALARLTGTSSLWGRLLLIVGGCMLFRLLVAGALLAGVHPNALKALVALLVLLVAALPQLQKRSYL
ncbi:MAG: hypothetical protein RMK52_09755 [Chitinophagales bacterium]|nr:hypothetical protein [Chitinophagales bacterium]MDW8394511.1 hypothetical protein [Chitinophagales bacterium]